MEIAVIGSDEFVLGFRLAGIRRVFVANSENYQEKMLEAMSQPTIGILAVDAKDLDNLSHQLRLKVMDSIQPVIVPVGGDDGDLREKVKRAIGVDLYKTEDA
ncbi:MAG: V-type ATP synthase subunit F [Candidatus Methanomethylophilaceae archaeon]|nr:V-type ATP synthase subunit F [Thermoplasmata archaeon]MBP3385293.1 V-type ATP synthase subunit F [Candidatus Methanomethylophilaceae archaeon]MBQ7405338.1 V-type ATP synthase subunit F [Candidatus Methanomethylophilaceae archaeon]MBQ8643964.1 V-type ATP synthase subunit F [Candidatus Methanomethylophilaceae archaeon]MBR2347876.1 V-type ATP synthase subunit F [Candidatus Methanomethylophilaceae archaeon]